MDRANLWPECEEFYNLMQIYRHTPPGEITDVYAAYEDVKEWLRDHRIPEETWR